MQYHLAYVRFRNWKCSTYRILWISKSQLKKNLQLHASCSAYPVTLFQEESIQDYQYARHEHNSAHTREFAIALIRLRDILMSFAVPFTNLENRLRCRSGAPPQAGPPKALTGAKSSNGLRDIHVRFGLPARKASTNLLKMIGKETRQLQSLSTQITGNKRG